MKKRFLIIAAMCLSMRGPFVSGETFTYQTVRGNDTASTIYSIQELRNGKKVSAEYHLGGGVSFSEVIMTDSFSTQSWRYTCRKEKSDLCGSIVNDTVVLKGICKNKPMEKVYPLKSIVWRQMFPFDLKKFVLSDSLSTSFCGVSIIALAYLKLGTLEVKKIGVEHIAILGKCLELVHIRVSLPGLNSVFWHGDYWFTKDDGMLIKSVSYDLPGSPPVVSVLEKLSCDSTVQTVFNP